MLFKTKWSAVMHTSGIGGTQGLGPREINQMSQWLPEEHTTTKGKTTVQIQYDLLPWWSWLSSGWSWLSHSLISKLDGLRTLKVKNTGQGGVGIEKTYLHTYHIYTVEWGYLFHPLGNVIGKLENLASCAALPLIFVPSPALCLLAYEPALIHFFSSLSHGKNTKGISPRSKGRPAVHLLLFPWSV